MWGTREFEKEFRMFEYVTIELNRINRKWKLSDVLYKTGECRYLEQRGVPLYCSSVLARNVTKDSE